MIDQGIVEELFERFLDYKKIYTLISVIAVNKIQIKGRKHLLQNF